MRENSGKGKGKNNNLDPTLEENRGRGGTDRRDAEAGKGEMFDIAGNARTRGEDPSPDDRQRGETSINDRSSPVDLDHQP